MFAIGRIPVHPQCFLECQSVVIIPFAKLDAFICFFEEITKWVDYWSPVDVIYLDFQKAFDKDD